MMARKLAAVILLIVTVYGTFTLRSEATSNERPKYIFINETSDHRFDESIRVSIMAAQKRSSVQNAVYITDRTSDDLAQFAAKEFQHLEVGKAYGGKGILYVFSPSRKALKIELSYNLEGDLPDLRVAELERAAKTFIFSDRYQDFWAELLITLNMRISKGEQGQKLEPLEFLSGGAGILSGTYAATPEQLAREIKKDATRKRTKRFDTPTEAYVAYLSSLLTADPAEANQVLSTESLVSRELTPLTTAQLRRNWRMYGAAGDPQFYKRDGLAFVLFEKTKSVLPIVLESSARDGWKVQEPLSWALFQRFEDSNQVFLKFDFGDQVLTEKFGDPLYPLATKPNFLATVNDDVLKLFFRLYALPTVESKLGSQPSKALTDLELWVLADSQMNLGHYSSFLNSYREAAERHPNLNSVKRSLAFYESVLNFNASEWKLTR